MMNRKTPRWACCVNIGLALVCLSLGGCGGNRSYPVRGKVVYKNSEAPASDLAGFVVTFESIEQPISASGEIKPDGTFEVSTYKEGDGAAPGRHRVALTRPIPDDDRPRPRSPIHARYERLESSGLEVSIVPGRNEVTLVVEPRATR